MKRTSRPAHLRELLDAHGSLRDRFERSAEPYGEDGSESAYDWAVAVEAAQLGLAAEDVYVLTRASRLIHLNDEKARERDDYFVATALRAVEWWRAVQREELEGFRREPLGDEKGEVQAPDPSRFDRLARTAREWAEVKPPPPVVDGLVAGRGLVTFWGRWGLGKTYVALDLGLAVAAGLETWHGRRLWLHGPVVFLASEGEFNLPTRRAGRTQTRSWVSGASRPASGSRGSSTGFRSTTGSPP